MQEEALVEETTEKEPTRLEDANKRIKNHVVGAMAASLIPVPLVDMVALTGIQLKLLHSLSKLYEVDFSKDLGKKLVSSLLGGVVPASSAMGFASAASAAKLIPGLGTATGVIAMSALGGGATYAVGKVFVQHFESGGTFLNFDPEAVRGYFAEQFEEGKKLASKLKPGAQDGSDEKEETKEEAPK